MKKLKYLNYKISSAINFIIFFSVASVVYYSLQSNPLLDYDESNTIRIASQSIRNIFDILNHEQNFPLYYIIIHIFSGNIMMIKFLNLIIWLLNVYFAKCVFDLTISENSYLRKISLLAYIFTPYIHYYSYYIRPYGLINLILVTELYLIIRRILTNKGYSFISFILSIIICSLHPIGIIAGVIMQAVSYLSFKEKKATLVIKWIFLILVFILNIYWKIDAKNAYLGSGTSYIEIIKMDFRNLGPIIFLTKAFFYDVDVSHNRIKIILPLLCATCSIFYFFNTNLCKRQIYLAILSLAGPFFLVPVMLNTRFATHHTAFFIVPCAVFFISYTLLYLAEELTEKSSKFYMGIKVIFIASILIYIISNSKKYDIDNLRSVAETAFVLLVCYSVLTKFIFCKVIKHLKLLALIIIMIFFIQYCLDYFSISKQRSDELGLLCTSLSKLSADDNGKILVVVNFSDYNVVHECMDEKSISRILMLTGPSEILDISNFNQFEILMMQSKLGGTILKYPESLKTLKDKSTMLNALALETNSSFILYANSWLMNESVFKQFKTSQIFKDYYPSQLMVYTFILFNLYK